MSDAAIAAGSDPLAELSADQIARWEDLLAYVTDPDCPRPSARTDTPRLLSHLLGRAGVDETEFWTFARNRRSRVLRAGYARQCRDVPGLELSAFDLDKLLKERFRREPLTIGAAWHHGYFRSYFSHAAITHPANDGLREEFSTAWDIVRKRPAVVLRGGVGARRRESLADLAAVRLDLPMIVGPLPYAAVVDLEIAYLQAIAAADAAADLRTRSLVVIPADRALRHAAELQPYAQALLVRLAPRHARLLGGVAREGGRRDGDGDGVGRDGGLAEDCDALAALLRGARIVELDPWSDGEGGGGELAELAAAALRVNPDLLLSVYLRYAVAAADGDATTATAATAIGTAADGDAAADGSPFWERLVEAAGTAGVALLHYHAGPLKSYRLTPRVDAFLKERRLRARVQIVSAGGDSDTQASAATVYESVLLGANGGAMTYAAVIPLVPQIVDALAAAANGAAGGGLPPEPTGRALVERALAAGDPAARRDLALCSLSCWQHSILDFLSCMGIDDIQKTSGNAMAITMTADWVREVDALATPEFGALNAARNRARVAAEPAPPEVAARFRVSALLGEREPGLPLPEAARVLADGGASYHVDNSSRALNADFLEVIYRMAAGELPRLDDFFVAGDHDEYSLDRVGLRLSRASVAWSLSRLSRDPALLDYLSLAVPRGFLRPGAADPGARVTVHGAPQAAALVGLEADVRGGFEARLRRGHPLERALEGDEPLWLRAVDAAGHETLTELCPVAFAAADAPDGRDAPGAPGGRGTTVLRASAGGAVTIRRDPRGGLIVSGASVREPIWHGPVCHASTSLGAASEDYLIARIEGAAGLTMTSSGEGGPLRLAADDDMRWESLQAASGHFGITGADLRRVRDVEIKINQGAKPGKGGRLAGAKVTPTVSKARNIPVGTDALSPDPKHDIYSIEDMPAEVWLWLLYRTYCGIKITGSNYTRYVAAGMWSNFVVDYLLIDAGTGGSGNYHGDSAHVGWPDAFRTILHTHHALMGEQVDLDGSGRLSPIRDGNGAPYGASGGTRLLASGGLRGELDMLKVLIAGADGLVEGTIGKAAAFGCTQCGNCHLDCPRGGITTKRELTVQNERDLMRRRMRNWTALNMVKLAVLVDALNRESGALGHDGAVAHPELLIDDIRLLRGRTDLLEMPVWPADADGGEGCATGDDAAAAAPAAAKVPPAAAPAATPAADHDSCRVGSLAVSEPVTVDAVWEAARRSFNGGNNRGGGIDFAGFAPPAVRDLTAVMINTIGPDRRATLGEMLAHFGGCRFVGADGAELSAAAVLGRLDEFVVPVRERYREAGGWRAADLREDPGDFALFFVDVRPDVLARYGRRLLAGDRWLQRQTKYGGVPDTQLEAALTALEATPAGRAAPDARLAAGFVADVREEYFSVLAHLLDSRYYRTHDDPGHPAPAGKYAAKRRGYVVSMGQDLAALKISGWTHTIPEYFDLGRFWACYPGAVDDGDGAACALRAYVWGMHHRYPTNSPALDAEGRGNPAGAHPFKAYNVLLMHNGEQVGVDSTSPFLCEFGYVHSDESMGEGAALYEGDSLYDRKALTDTEYAAYLIDFTRRVLGLSTEEASQIVSPITGIDLAAIDGERRRRLALLGLNYVQLTPTGPYKFTIVESRPGDADGRAGADGRDGNRSPGAAPRRVGFRENMDIKFLRPHELVVSVDTGPGGVQAVANGSEAKIADAMLRELHRQGVLADAGHDLRFSMRPGGNPGSGELGGVVEAFVTPGEGRVTLVNRFGEPVAVPRAGRKVALSHPLRHEALDPGWRSLVDESLRGLAAELPRAVAAAGRGRRFLGPDDPLPGPAAALVSETLARLATLSHADYRYLVEEALPDFAAGGGAQVAGDASLAAGKGGSPAAGAAAARGVALRVLAELRKRVAFCDLGGKALSSIEYLTDGGRDAAGRAEGGVARLLDAVPLLPQALAAAAGRSAAGSPPAQRAAAAGLWARLTAATRDDLLPPSDPVGDVLVIDFAGFASESFGLDCGARFVSEAVRLGWRNLVGFGCLGGPRYLGVNLADEAGAPAEGVVLELFGRESGDFLGALLEGARIWLYGQAQCHVGMKADSGYLFVLQDGLNTCLYAAHGGTLSIWDSGSRFAVAGQNKVLLGDGVAPAPGLKSIHFGTPNEYAFEYLMSGGENSLHVVMGLAKPDARGELALKPRPYAGKFFMSGAAAGRVLVFDPQGALDPAQYHGNVVHEIAADDWQALIGPFIADEARRRGLPLRVEGDDLVVRLQGQWRRFRYDEAFLQLIPQKVARKLARQGITPPQLEQIVGE